MLNETVIHNLRYLSDKRPDVEFTTVDAISFYKFLTRHNGDVDLLFHLWYNTYRDEVAN